MNERPSVGQRLGRFALFVVVLFVVTVTVIVTQRLSDDALALLVGLGAGVVFMVPPLFIMVLVWRRQELRREDRWSERQQAAQPSVVVVAPPAFPGYGPGYGRQQSALPYENLAPWSAPAERKFTIVGGEG